MLKSKSKKLATLCCAIALVATCAISAFAAPVTWSVTLPAASQQVDIRSGVHQTSTSNVSASVTSMGGSYDDVYMFVRALFGGSWQDVSTSHEVYEGGGAVTIPFNTSVPTGTTLMLVGGNSDWTTVTVAASGTVDFH